MEWSVHFIFPTSIGNRVETTREGVYRSPSIADACSLEIDSTSFSTFSKLLSTSGGKFPDDL